MEDAGADSDVVTPLGDSPTCNGAVDGAACAVVVVDVCGGAGGFEAQAAITRPVATSAPAATALPRYLRTPPMYAIMDAVIERVGTRECCRA